MNDDFRAEMQALGDLAAAELRAVPRIVMLTPLDKPDRGWCVPCGLPSRLEWRVAFELGTDFDVRTVSVCTGLWGRERRVNVWCLIFGHRLLPFPRDVFAPIRCHRCGWTGP